MLRLWGMCAAQRELPLWWYSALVVPRVTRGATYSGHAAVDPLWGHSSATLIATTKSWLHNNQWESWCDTSALTDQ